MARTPKTIKQTMEHRKQAQTDGIERRYVTDGLEYRAGDSSTGTLRGYALRFGSVYDMGWFTEEVDRRALDNADLTDVRVLLNHDANNILGRTAAGTATVGIDDNGLWYEVQLPDSPNGQNARVAIERGDITQSSWGFMLRSTKEGNGDRWEKRNGKEHRVLTDVRTVYDASPVTFPANPDTTIAKRSLEAIQQAETEAQQRSRGQAEFETLIDIALMERQRHNHIIKTK